ncbi:IS1595 family transposase [Candidatus Saccharibacteria bacterium]|nr:IS1595 family transposase [Candidatus Saccharibacteria bacterium]
MRYTFKDFKEEYPDDTACLNAVLENRYGNTCPRCGVIGVKFHPITGRQGFVCSECDKHIYPLAGTIFRKSTTSLWSWFYAIYLFSVSKNGVSAKELERHLGVTYKTAWRMAKQIRLLMEQDGEILTGDVEVDETYAPSRKHPRALGHSKKQVIFGAVERNGRVNASHVKSAGVRVLMPIIENNIQAEATIYSDEARVYKTLNKRGYSHTTVNHSKLEYVRGNAHTNTIEGFWSQLKRSIDGTYHAVSPKYLQSYINQFVFQYNFRDLPTCPVLLERAAKLS